MIILKNEEINIDKFSRISTSHFVTIFGEGLIGSSIRDELQFKFGFTLLKKYKLNWGSLRYKSQIEEVFNFIQNEYNISSIKNIHMSFIWSAGKIGFGATETEVEKEEADFNFFIESLGQFIEINFIGSINSHNEKLMKKLDFHFLSSAGGLFEGQSQVSYKSEPNPLRPYGFLKLKQENRIEVLAKKLVKADFNIYRPSTIYGRIEQGHRLGLIATMIKNGILKQVTPITGDFYTLRDYLHVGDLTQMILNRVINQKNDPLHNQSALRSESKLKSANIFFCISQKPTTIYEIRSILEFYLKHRLYVKYIFRPDNSKDITFERMDLDLGVTCRDVRSGIKDVLIQWYGVSHR